MVSVSCEGSELPRTEDYHELSPAARRLIGFGLIWRLLVSYLLALLVFWPLNRLFQMLLRRGASSLGLPGVRIASGSGPASEALLLLLCFVASLVAALWFLHSTFGPYRLRLVRSYLSMEVSHK